MRGEFVIPWRIPWVAKYISWVDSLDWRVQGFLSLGGFLEWRSTHLSFYNIYSSHHLLVLTVQIQFSNHNPKLSKSCSILLKPFQKPYFTLETINTIIPNLKETPNSCIALAYLKQTRKMQTSSKKSCFASNQT